MNQDISYLDDYTEHYDDSAYDKPSKKGKKSSRRCWREIERRQELAQLKRQLWHDDFSYFDQLDHPLSTEINNTLTTDKL